MITIKFSLRKLCCTQDSVQRKPVCMNFAEGDGQIDPNGSGDYSTRINLFPGSALPVVCLDIDNA